ncbi:MAG TPA: DUF2652 domain-containing protein [Ohtaekwangia sp.]
MENRGLLFIPDISGFTQFISENEIDHSRLIIQELLEILISSNEMGLEISEIEGDAILFYKFGDMPDLNVVYHQVEKMFRAFHQNLAAYEQHRYCQCKACASAKALTLKVITHYGEFTGYNVRNFNKLIGKDLIVAHQLLKNDVPQHEYWLITNTMSGMPPQGFTQWMTWGSSTKKTEGGVIPFYYTQLSALRNEIAPDEHREAELRGTVKILSIAQDFETDIISLFHATGDFRYRSRWYEGVKKVEIVNHFLPRVGMKCRCIGEAGETIIYANSYRYSPDKITFSESDELKSTLLYFTLERTGKKKTRLTLDVHRKSGFLDMIAFRLFKKGKLESGFRRSMKNLTELVKELKIPTAVD